MHYSRDADAVTEVRQKNNNTFTVVFGDGYKVDVKAPSEEVAVYFANPQYCSQPCPVD